MGQCPGCWSFGSLCGRAIGMTMHDKPRSWRIYWGNIIFTFLGTEMAQIIEILPCERIAKMDQIANRVCEWNSEQRDFRAVKLIILHRIRVACIIRQFCIRLQTSNAHKTVYLHSLGWWKGIVKFQNLKWNTQTHIITFNIWTWCLCVDMAYQTVESIRYYQIPE